MNSSEDIITSKSIIERMANEDPEIYRLKVKQGKIVDNEMIDPSFGTCWHAMLEVRKTQREHSQRT